MAPERQDWRRACVLGDAGRPRPAGSVLALRRGIARQRRLWGGDRAWRSPWWAGRNWRAALPGLATRTSPHCSEGATEANAGLKVAPPAKVAWEPERVERSSSLGHDHFLDCR